MPKPAGRILVTGSTGQIGSELLLDLRKRYGEDAVLAGFYPAEQSRTPGTDSSVLLDVTDPIALKSVLREWSICAVYHLAGVLSAAGEENPDLAWTVNVEGLRNVLRLSAENGIRVFWPSSVAVFGDGVPRENAAQDAPLFPRTMYGTTKVAGELLCRYYHDKFGLDVRSIRYPGVISSLTPPGGGTTDYAVEIFYAAVQRRRYTCFVKKDTVLPMMYIPDCIRATIRLMEAAPPKVRYRMGYNVNGVSFSAGELAARIGERVPGFVCDYKPDFRQTIADSWPRSVDDSRARHDWGWKPDSDLDFIIEDMLGKLSRKLVRAR